MNFSVFFSDVLLMPRKKTTKKSKRTITKTASKKKNVELKPWLPLLIQSLVILLSGFGTMHALSAVKKKIIEQPQFLIKFENIDMGQTPSWLVSTKELQFDLKAVVGEKSLFDEDLESLVHDNLLKSPWVKDVLSVERELPNNLSISLLPRRPIACLKHQGRKYYLDADGIVLPTTYYKNLGYLPYLTGIKSKKLFVGKKHPSKLVPGALDFLKNWYQREMTVKYPRLNVSSIDCATKLQNLSGKPDFMVYIDQGSRDNRVHLLFDKGDNAGEVKIDKALDNLEKIMIKDPHLSHIQLYIDLRDKYPLIQ